MRDSFNGRTSVFQTENGSPILPSRTAECRGQRVYVSHMNSSLYSFLANIGGLGLLIAAVVVLTSPELISNHITASNQIPDVHLEQSATVISATSTPPETPEPEIIAENIDKTDTEEDTPDMQLDVPVAQPLEQATTSEVTRITNPYSFAPHESATLNQEARAALVNILCESSSKSLKSISGSGIIIDPRGIVITNAHVAQYALLADNLGAGVKCSIRTGSPARAVWHPKVLYFPAKWIEKHAVDITESRPVGTGEHDYALLFIAESIDGTLLPQSFPHLPYDAREKIGFAGDPILIAAYPAEFSGSSATRNALYVSSVFTNIKQMMTFDEQLVDMLSLGGTAVAQSGSSGGAVVNLWGYVIGMITTTSEGETTESRDLRAITFAHVDRSVRDHTGTGLQELLAHDPATQAANFITEARELSQKLIDEIEKKQSGNI